MRTAELVLGAEAMQTAELKSITAKHLAMAAQTMLLLGVVVPMLHDALALRLILLDGDGASGVDDVPAVGRVGVDRVYGGEQELLLQLLAALDRGDARPALRRQFKQLATAFQLARTSAAIRLLAALDSSAPRRAAHP